MYLSAHGFGHAVRAAAVVARLAERLPLRLTVIASCDRRIWPDALLPVTEAWIDEATDAGVVQTDDVTVDLEATEATLDAWLANLPGIVERERRRLSDSCDLVIGDVPSPAFTAADLAQIPGVAIANFTWDWIYETLGFARAATASADGYRAATLLLQAMPYGPMPAFERRIDVGLIARRPVHTHAAARLQFGVEDEESVVLLAFQPAFASSVVLPPPRRGRTFFAPPGWPAPAGRGDVRLLTPGSGFADALAAADVVVGKPGYGLISDVEAAGARFLYVPRPGFPENAVLEGHLSARAATRSVPASAMASGEWDEALSCLETDARPPAASAGGAERAAAAIAELVGAAGERRQLEAGRDVQ